MMMELKRKVDEYFGLDEITVGGQLLYYGTIGLMALIVTVGLLTKVVG
jgi:hypothetical protein